MWSDAFKSAVGAIGSIAVDAGTAELKRQAGMPQTRPGAAPVPTLAGLVYDAAERAGCEVEWDGDSAVLALGYGGREWRVQFDESELMVQVLVLTGLSGLGEALLARSAGVPFGGWFTRDGRHGCKGTVLKAGLDGVTLHGLALLLVGEVAQVYARCGR